MVHFQSPVRLLHVWSVVIEAFTLKIIVFQTFVGQGRVILIELLFIYIYVYLYIFFFKRRIDLYINHVYFVQGEQDRTEETSETKRTGGGVEEVAENLAHIYTYRSGLASH
jgi:hypothetical protein